MPINFYEKDRYIGLVYRCLACVSHDICVRCPPHRHSTAAKA
ncbi:MAG: hypothetical protein HOM58_22950 [Rhodospirillaceae bacterium]|nr:hypothetical protein [Rhodospirillaceae bacterium]MBT5459405.1 hypothetical protein [Rhodospirillaceae bacterium]